MKRLNYKILIPGVIATVVMSFSCKNFLDKTPPGTLNTAVLANKAGVDALLIGAYSLLDGVYNGEPGPGPWATGTGNWVYGGVAADDAFKGSESGDQPDINQIETYVATSGNGYLDPKWRVMFNGVSRANDVLREIPLVTDGSVSSAQAAQYTAEARFLRGFYHMELARLWRNVPYADETITYSAGNYTIGNPGPIWDKIEADFAAAVAVLPTTQPQVGRANKYAAEAFLAKAYLYDHKYTQALTALNDIINNGVNQSGVKYALVANYADVFNPLTKNGSESILQVQSSVGDNANGLNGNGGDVLNFPYNTNPIAGCCGFNQPSFSMVNSYKTGSDGLPLLDTYDNQDLKNDGGVAASALYMPDSSQPLDSRLDWSVGRRGIPLLDYGIMQGGWTRDPTNGGPYLPMKNFSRKATQSSQTDLYGGWAANQSTAYAYNLVRYADVLLWAAECEIEVGSLAKAQTYVNMIRARAANTSGWVKGRLTGYNGSDASKPNVDYSQYAANYNVGLYGQTAANTFSVQGQAYARKAVQFEHKLEFGMEGHRFFDLQRWDGIYGGPMPKGFMGGILNAYIAHVNTETTVPNLLTNFKTAKFTVGTSELFPVPQTQIDATQGAIKQNPGY